MERKVNKGWILSFGLTAFLLVAATSTPFLAQNTRAIISAAFTTVCHQLPDRTFHFNGIPFGVCHRCYGIYSAMWLGTIIFVFLGEKRDHLEHYGKYLLIGSLIPPGIDWLAGIMNLWSNSMLSRLITGAFFGFAAGIMLANSFYQAASGLKQDQEVSQLPLPQQN